MKRTLAVNILGALLALTFLLSGCGDTGDDAESSDAGSGTQASDVKAPTETFATWEEYVDSDAGPSGRQVVFIGIDAGVWHFMDRLIDEGRLPNVARIKREGAYGSLISVDNYVTPPAWTSLFTGYLPHRTGVYTFGFWDEEAQQFWGGNSGDILVPSVWEVASSAGLKVGVFNVPMTYPPRPVNGAMVTGQMTPIEVTDAVALQPAPHKGLRYKELFQSAPGVTSYHEPAPALLEDSLNTFLVLLHDTVDDKRTKFDTAAMTIMSKDAAGEPSEVLSFETFPVGRYSRWLRFNYLKNGEAVPAYTRVKIDATLQDFQMAVSQTVFPIDVTFTYPEALADELNERYNYYLPTKFLAKEVVPTLTEDMVEYAKFFYDYDDWDLFCFVFTQTDNIQHLVGHGGVAGDVYATIDGLIGDMMERLPAGATLIIGSDHGSTEYRYGIDMNQRLAEMKLLEWKTPNKIDYDRTIVFHNLWHYYFNGNLITREELSRRGYDVPISADPREWLIESLRRIDVRAGLIKTVSVEATPLPGDAAGNAPDMQVKGTYGEYVVEFWNIMKPHSEVVIELEGSEKFWHTKDAVYLVWGDAVREGYDGGEQDITNVAPTMLYLLGLPVADDMDGEVMTNLFSPGFVSGHPLRVNRGYLDMQREAVSADAERESLQKKLRSLGYIQ